MSQITSTFSRCAILQQGERCGICSDRSLSHRYSSILPSFYSGHGKDDSGPMLVHIATITETKKTQSGSIEKTRQTTKHFFHERCLFNYQKPEQSHPAAGTPPYGYLEGDAAYFRSEESQFKQEHSCPTCNQLSESTNPTYSIEPKTVSLPKGMLAHYIESERRESQALSHSPKSSSDEDVRAPISEPSSNDEAPEVNPPRTIPDLDSKAPSKPVSDLQKTAVKSQHTPAQTAQPAHASPANVDPDHLLMAAIKEGNVGQINALICMNHVISETAMDELLRSDFSLSETALDRLFFAANRTEMISNR